MPYVLIPYFLILARHNFLFFQFIVCRSNTSLLHTLLPNEPALVLCLSAQCFLKSLLFHSGRILDSFIMLYLGSNTLWHLEYNHRQDSWGYLTCLSPHLYHETDNGSICLKQLLGTWRAACTIHSSTMKASLREGSLQFGFSPKCVMFLSNRLSLSCSGGQPRGMTRTCIVCGVHLEPPFWTMQKRYPTPGSGIFLNDPWFLRAALSSHAGYPQTTWFVHFLGLYFLIDLQDNRFLYGFFIQPLFLLALTPSSCLLHPPTSYLSKHFYLSISSLLSYTCVLPSLLF